MKLEAENLNEAQNPQLNIGAVMCLVYFYFFVRWQPLNHYFLNTKIWK